MYNHVLYLGYWVVTSIVLILINSLFPDAVVLGNWRLASIESSVYAGFWITFFVWAAWDYIFVRGVKLSEPGGAWAFFAFINILAVWLTARFSHIAGFGLSNFWWAIIVGILINFGQRFAFSIIVNPKRR